MLYNNADFYPTPEHLATEMLNMVDLKCVHFVLEPSAGKGDLVNALKDKMYYLGIVILPKSGSDVEIDCIEQDKNLQDLLKSAGNVLFMMIFLILKPIKNMT